MKIEFTKPRELVDLARTVKPGDLLESPKDAPEELLRAYVQNGIAIEARLDLKPAPPAAPSSDSQKTEGGD